MHTAHKHCVIGNKGASRGIKLMAWDKPFGCGSMGRRWRVFRPHLGGDPKTINNSTEAGHAKTENHGQLSFMEKLRNSMIELATSQLGHSLSGEGEEINHIDLDLPKIFHDFLTPNYPPCSEMIYRAIEALEKKDSLGSSRGCI
ncbi:hypothetical protein RIF29_06471 [Crotalaria pallida]|uniref:Uncharacterized protein n=1 Tax=Crotalaria pallida TaxID=3830 RepID=A0AAN9PAC4_CROPI